MKNQSSFNLQQIPKHIIYWRVEQNSLSQFPTRRTKPSVSEETGMYLTLAHLNSTFFLHHLLIQVLWLKDIPYYFRSFYADLQYYFRSIGHLQTGSELSTTTLSCLVW
jgi:hypothetical protein